MLFSSALLALVTATGSAIALPDPTVSSPDATATFAISDLTFQAGPNNSTAMYSLSVTNKANGAKTTCKFSNTGGTSHCPGAPAIGGFAKRACADSAWSWAVTDQTSKSDYNLQLSYKNAGSTLTGNLAIKYSQFVCIAQCAGCYSGEYLYNTKSATVVASS